MAQDISQFSCNERCLLRFGCGHECLKKCSECVAQDFHSPCTQQCSIRRFVDILVMPFVEDVPLVKSNANSNALTKPVTRSAIKSVSHANNLARINANILNVLVFAMSSVIENLVTVINY